MGDLTFLWLYFVKDAGLKLVIGIVKEINHEAIVARAGVCFTKTKIELKLDLTMASHSCH